MLSAGYFRIRNALPGPVWTYPISYIAFHTYSIQAREFTMSFAIFFPLCITMLKNYFQGTWFSFKFLEFYDKGKKHFSLLHIRNSNISYSGTSWLILTSLTEGF